MHLAGSKRGRQADASREIRAYLSAPSCSRPTESSTPPPAPSPSPRAASVPHWRRALGLRAGRAARGTLPGPTMALTVSDLTADTARGGDSHMRAPARTGAEAIFQLLVASG